jgi:hypothetical protein
LTSNKALWYVCDEQSFQRVFSFLKEFPMRPLSVLFVILTAFTFVAAQTRDEAIKKFEDLKIKADLLEKIIMSPDKADIEAAVRDNVNVFRLMPARTNDDTYTSIRGAGSVYSFYFRRPDFGHGADISLAPEDLLYVQGVSGIALVTDLGEIPFNTVSLGIESVSTLINYQNLTDVSRLPSTINSLPHDKNFEIEKTSFRRVWPATVGHTFIGRFVQIDYYDTLIAFNIRRKDNDGSLIIFWKMLDQFDTQKSNLERKTKIVTDEELLERTTRWKMPDLFPDVQYEIKNGVVTLRGTIPKKFAAYAVQLANSAGATKVINQMTIK